MRFIHHLEVTFEGIISLEFLNLISFVKYFTKIFLYLVKYKNDKEWLTYKDDLSNLVIIVKILLLC